MTKLTQLDSPHILEGSEGNFASLVLENLVKGPVLVNYWSPKAGPSLRLYPILDKLIHGFQGKLLMINVNTDEYGTLARDYGVTSLPTLKLFRNREVVETLHGYQTETELRAVLGRYVAQDSDVAIAQAVKMYHQEEAHRLLSTLPEDKHAIAEVRDLLAHLGFMLAAKNAPSKQHLEALVGKEMENLEARYQLCALRLIDDDYEGAMELLLEIMRRDSRFRNGVGRNGLLALFGLLGNGGELVDRYRKLMVQYLH